VEVPSGPFVLELDLHYLEMAEICALVPGATQAGRTVSISANDALELARCVEVFAHLAQAAPAPGR
jgi:D-aminopeptidase